MRIIILIYGAIKPVEFSLFIVSSHRPRAAVPPAVSHHVEYCTSYVGSVS